MIPVYQPEITETEKRYVNECLDSTWISSKGDFLPLFEKNFSKYTGIPYAAAVTNGTVALHLGMLALGIKEGDEVLVPALTYVASGNAVKYCGATPRFVDVCPSTWQISPEKILQSITPRTKAIMPVHLYGYPCDMDLICTIAAKHNLKIIEDCAEAFGTTYNGRHVGSFGALATFSFFGNKTISCGEGGMVVTNDPVLDRRIRSLKGQGLAKDQEYFHDVLGYNYRLTNIQAAIGVAQLERAENTLQVKLKLAQRYKSRLSHLPLTFPPENENCQNSYWMCTIVTENQKKCSQIRAHLKGRGIETRPFFTPLHLMPYYDGKAGDFPVSESLSERGINLPSWPGLTEQQISKVCDAIEECF